MTHPVWIWQYEQWPHFCWNDSNIISLLARVRQQQGQLLGLMSSLVADKVFRNGLLGNYKTNGELSSVEVNP